MSSQNNYRDPLPWGNLDQVRVTFSDAVSVRQEDLQVTGSIANVDLPTVASFEMTDDQTAVWTFEHTFDRNEYQLVLSDSILGAATSLELDGEWSSELGTPSGNGIAGGDFEFQFNVLPGDIDQSGAVTVLDVHPLRNALGTALGSADYSLLADLNGSGAVSINDLGPLRANLGDQLPASTQYPFAHPVPEPTSDHLFLVALAFMAFVISTRRNI